MKVNLTERELLVLSDGISKLIDAEIDKRAESKWKPEVVEETQSEIEMLTELQNKLLDMIY